MFSPIQYVDAKLLTKDLTDKTYIVTGANSGVGLETTRQLIKQGAHVVMACRNLEAAKKEAQSFQKLKGSYAILKIDLASLQSVRDFVKAFLKKYKKLDGLVCNAGMITLSKKVAHTMDGLETTMAVGYFGHFLLTELLLDLLKKDTPSRIVLLSSVLHAGKANKRPQIHFEDLNYKKRKFSSFGAYAESKVAMVLYAKELAHRLKGTGVTTASVHPGWVRSNFGKKGHPFLAFLMKLLSPFIRPLSENNVQGAQTSLYCLLSDEAPKHNGAYFSQRSRLYEKKEERGGGWPMPSPNPYAKKLATAQKLVQVSYPLVGLTPPL